MKNKTKRNLKGVDIKSGRGGGEGGGGSIIHVDWYSSLVTGIVTVLARLWRPSLLMADPHTHNRMPTYAGVSNFGCRGREEEGGRKQSE